MTTTTDPRPLTPRGLALAALLLSTLSPGGSAHAAKPVCKGGKVVVDEGCCWPGQRWSSGRCEGTPRCTGGTIASKGECVTRAEYAASLGRSCASMPVGLTAVADDNPGRRACDELASMVGDGEAGWRAGCERDDAASCLLLGAAKLGYRTAGARVELWVARCRSNDCNGHRRSQERLGFAGGSLDASGARAAFERGCKAGSGPACVELAALGSSAAKQVQREACVAHAEVSACSDAGYQIGIVGRVTDAELFGAIERTLGGSCDAGSGLACNNLGFFEERKLLGGRSAKAAADRYQQACAKGSSLGCANLAMVAARNASLVRGIAWGDARKTLEAACDESREATHHDCLALATALQRGFGGKAEPRQGQALAKRLCKAGFPDACLP